jgi:uncharacterized protein YycO
MLLPGDIIVVKSQTVVGKCIRHISKSWASHVAVYVGDGYVFEARPGGAKRVPLANYEGKKWEYRIYRPQIPKWQLEKFLAILQAKHGRGYDYGQIFSIAAKYLFNIEIKAQSKRLAICSEIIYEAAKEAGIRVPKIKQAYVTPGDFEKCKILVKVWG